MTTVKKKVAPMTFTRADLPAHCHLVTIEAIVEASDLIDFNQSVDDALDRLTEYASAEVTERAVIAHSFQEAVDILKRRAVD